MILSEENGKEKEGRKNSSDFLLFFALCQASPHSEKCFMDLLVLERFRVPISYETRL